MADTQNCGIAAAEIQDLTAHASALEDIIHETYSLISAIDLAELFEGISTDAEALEKRQVGYSLLSIARRRLNDAGSIPGTDLSIKLSCLAYSEARNG